MAARYAPSPAAADMLVTIEHGEAVTDTWKIAQASGVEHSSVIKLVREHLADFESFGRVRFQIEPFMTAGGIQSREVAELNQPQTTLLFLYQRNTAAVRSVKIRVVKEFVAVTNELQRLKSQRDEPVWRSARLEAGRGYAFMSAVIHETREGTDKPATSLTYINEARVISYAMTGSHREKFCRESASPAELRLLERVETKNAILFARGAARKDREMALRLMVLNERGLLPPPQPPASKRVTGKAR